VTPQSFILISLLILSIGLSSCLADQELTASDKKLYQRVTQIIFPKNIHLIESVDNGEFVISSSFHIDSVFLKQFINEYGFDTLQKYYPSQFLGEHLLKKERPNLNNPKSLLYVAGQKGKNSWIYIIDLKSNRLWAEVQYPDMGGH